MYEEEKQGLHGGFPDSNILNFEGIMSEEPVAQE